MEFFAEADYKLALIEFQRSYELVPNWRILYNIGAVHFQLMNHAAALQTLEKYLAEGGKEIPEQRRADVEKDIESLKARTAHLTITVVNVPGADVTIDDVLVGKAPVQSRLVDAGDRRVSVSKVGYRTSTQLVTLAGKDARSISITLVEEAKAPGQVEAEHPSYVWVGWVATGALAVGAVVTGIVSLDAKSELDGLRKKQGVTRDELDGQERKMKNYGITTDVLAGAAILTGGVTLYFTLKGSGKASATSSMISVAPRPGLALGVGTGRLLLQGDF